MSSGSVLEGIGTWASGKGSGESSRLGAKSSLQSLRRTISNLSLSSTRSDAPLLSKESASSGSSRSSSPLSALRRTTSDLYKSLVHQGRPGLSTVRASDQGDSETSDWTPPAPFGKAPDTDEEVQSIIQEAYSRCETPEQRERFMNWLEVKRAEGKNDREIAYELWNAPYIIAHFRRESDQHRCLQELDARLAFEAKTKLDVELADDLVRADKKMQAARKFAEKHQQEPVFQRFLDEGRRRRTPDLVLVAELSFEGVPPWAPPKPEGDKPISAEQITASLDRAYNAAEYRGKGLRFIEWFKEQRSIGRSRSDMARDNWKAARIIRQILKESKANKCLLLLDRWLATEAETKLDVELAAALVHARQFLKKAGKDAARDGNRTAFRKFIKSERRDGKPDIIIVSELLKGGTPPWIPDRVIRTQARGPAPANDAEARAFIATTRSEYELVWLDRRYDNWISAGEIQGKSILEMAAREWEAPGKIQRFRNECLENCLPALDQWLASEARTKVDVELEEELVAAEEVLLQAENLARRGNRVKAFRDFIENARRLGKPNVIIAKEWEEHRPALVSATVPRESFDAIGEGAFSIPGSPVSDRSDYSLLQASDGSLFEGW